MPRKSHQPRTVPEESCVRNSAPDEPLFTLCARDITAPNIVRRWAQSAASLGAPAEKIGTAMLIAERMENWQWRHGMKVPD